MMIIVHRYFIVIMYCFIEYNWLNQSWILFLFVCFIYLQMRVCDLCFLYLVTADCRSSSCISHLIPHFVDLPLL